MGNNDFAYNGSQTVSFVVMNTSPQKKTIKIFHYPIPMGGIRDLLKIPGVGEGEIRASLLKGELNYKIRAHDIIVIQSDVDLIQFNLAQHNFLLNAGITSGTKITPSQATGFATSSGTVGYIKKEQVALIGAQNGSNRVFFTPDRFIEGTYNDNDFHISLFHNGRKLSRADFTISETGGMGYNTITFISFAPDVQSQIFADYFIAVT
jgi:hypothetical protein